MMIFLIGKDKFFPPRPGVQKKMPTHFTRNAHGSLASHTKSFTPFARNAKQLWRNVLTRIRTTVGPPSFRSFFFQTLISRSSSIFGTNLGKILCICSFRSFPLQGFIFIIIISRSSLSFGTVEQFWQCYAPWTLKNLNLVFPFILFAVVFKGEEQKCFTDIFVWCSSTFQGM